MGAWANCPSARLDEHSLLGIQKKPSERGGSNEKAIEKRSDCLLLFAKRRIECNHCRSKTAAEISELKHTKMHLFRARLRLDFRSLRSILLVSFLLAPQSSSASSSSDQDEHGGSLQNSSAYRGNICQTSRGNEGHWENLNGMVVLLLLAERFCRSD